MYFHPKKTTPTTKSQEAVERSVRYADGLVKRGERIILGWPVLSVNEWGIGQSRVLARRLVGPRATESKKTKPPQTAKTRRLLGWLALSVNEWGVRQARHSVCPGARTTHRNKPAAEGQIRCGHGPLEPRGGIKKEPTIFEPRARHARIAFTR